MDERKTTKEIQIRLESLYDLLGHCDDEALAEAEFKIKCFEERVWFSEDSVKKNYVSIEKLVNMQGDDLLEFIIELCAENPELINKERVE